MDHLTTYAAYNDLHARVNASTDGGNYALVGARNVLSFDCIQLEGIDEPRWVIERWETPAERFEWVHALLGAQGVIEDPECFREAWVFDDHEQAALYYLGLVGLGLPNGV